MFRVNNKKKGKASGLFLACMPSKQHAPAPACHDKKPCRPYSYSRAGHAHVSAQPPLIDRSMVWKRKKKEEKKKRSHIRNVDGLHTSVKYQVLYEGVLADSIGMKPCPASQIACSLHDRWLAACPPTPNMSWLRFTVPRTSLQSSRASQPAAALSGCHAVTRGLNANISLSRHPVWAHVLNTARVSPEATHTADAQYVYSCR